MIDSSMPAPTEGTAPAAGGDAERELRQLEAQIADAIVRQDTTFVDHVFGEHFSYTGVRGEVRTKADILADLRLGDLRFESMVFDDIRVRVYGDAAVATGRAVVRGQSPQGPITGEFRYTRTYVRRQGGWQLVAFQGTPIARPQ